MSVKKRWLWINASVLGLAIAGFLYYRHVRRPLTISGAIVVEDTDFRKQLPIADVEVMLASGMAHGPVRSDASGFFSLRLFKNIRRGDPITLQFRRADYQPLNLQEKAESKLYIVHMVPLARSAAAAPARPVVTIANLRVRYSTKTQRLVNIGSAAKTFDVVNVGNVPCGRGTVCSPDGKWKAGVGSVNLDAGAGNEFRDVRLSCIAGPCPFTRVDTDNFSRGGQKISASVRGWSDTTTFLMEAEVIHTMANQLGYQSYPVIFGPAFSFTLPAQSENVSLEAEVSGETIIFPLGPDLLLDWATCGADTQNQTTIYRCELKSGYRFQ